MTESLAAALAAVSAEFWVRARLGGPDDCWPWQSRSMSSGYGQVSVKRDGKWGSLYAHRLAYTLASGPIPDGLTVDHVCHGRDETCPGGPTCSHRRCVNPNHLEAVPGLVNSARGRSTYAVNSRKTHCIRGHEFTEENTYRTVARGIECRQCRRCAADRARKRAADPGVAQ